MLELLQPGDLSDSSDDRRQSTADAEKPFEVILKQEWLEDGVWWSHEEMASLDDK